MDLINGIFPSYQNIDIINIEILILINRKNKFPLIFCSAKIPEKNCNSGGSLQTQYDLRILNSFPRPFVGRDGVILNVPMFFRGNTYVNQSLIAQFPNPKQTKKYGRGSHRESWNPI